MTTLKLKWDRLDPRRPPVVLLGGLSLVRALGLAAIPCIVVTRDPEEPALRSRYCIGGCLLPRSDPDSAVTVLCSLGNTILQRVGCTVPLMYGSDDHIELINGARERLQQHFRLVMSDPEVSEALLAKDRFHGFCRSHALPVPAAFEWDGTGADNLGAASGQILVKPKLKLDWHRSKVSELLFDGRGKARVFGDCREAMDNPTVARFRRQLHFQEYIPGAEDSLWSFHGFVGDRGEPVASFVGRKLRTYPLEMGESALIELAHDDELAALGYEIAKRCGIRGVFKMDFKRDPRDQRWYLLEINARFTLWHYLGAANGINLPAIVYDYLIFGRSPGSPPKYTTRVRWLSMPRYLRAYRDLAARSRLAFFPWLYRILRHPTVYSVFAWRDPVPWLWLVARSLRRLQVRLAGEA